MFRNRGKEPSVKNSTKCRVEESNLKQKSKYVCKVNKFRIKEDEITPPERESSILWLSNDARKQNIKERNYYYVLILIFISQNNQEHHHK